MTLVSNPKTNFNLREIRGPCENAVRRVAHQFVTLLLSARCVLMLRARVVSGEKNKANILLIGARFLTLRRIRLVNSKIWISEGKLLKSR
jgi:hypothetical protein